MNAFIVAQQRTGSTLLYEFLDSHPGIFCADELFIIKGQVDYRFRMIKVYNWYRKNKGWDVSLFLNWLFSLSEHSCVKILYHQIEWFKMEPIIFSTPVIHLIRNNYFKRVVSLYHTTEKINRKKPEEYINEIKASIRRDEMWGEALRNQCPKFLKLSFEELVGRHEIIRDINYTFCKEETGRKLCNFFGVPYFEMFTATQKALKSKNYWGYIPEKFREQLKALLIDNFSEEIWQ